MPAKVKVLWVFCNIVIMLGFVVLAYTAKTEEARMAEEGRQQQVLERERQKQELSKLKKAKAVHPTDPLKVIKELNALGKHEDAVKLAQDLAEKNPENASIFTWWGISLVKTGLRSAAIEKFVRSTTLDPTHTQAFLYWGLTLAMDGHFKDAIDKYETAIQLDPESSNAFTYKAASLDQLAKHKEALESAKRAIEINPFNAAAFEVMIESLRHSEDYESAWATVNRAKKQNIKISEKVIAELRESSPRP